MEEEVKLYCPHCDSFHLDNELVIDIDRDYVKCKVTNEEIKTYKGSANWKEWRTKNKLEV